MPEQVREVGKYVYELAEILRTALDSAVMDCMPLPSSRAAEVSSAAVNS
ncbi:hypothetical protein [Nocardia sp. NPDC004604]